MTRQTDPSDWEARFRALQRQVDQLARQTPLANASVTRGQVRIASAEGLVVEGSARIVGTMNGDGTLDWDGTVQFDGPVTINGAVTRNGNESATGTTTLNGLTTVNGDAIFNSSSQATFNGPVDIVGATDITGTLNATGNTTLGGTLSVTGATSLSNDLTVSGGGRIVAGDVEIKPHSITVGSLRIDNSGRLNDSSGTASLYGSLYLTAGAWGASSVSAPQLQARSAPMISGVTSNVYLDSTGMICRIT